MISLFEPLFAAVLQATSFTLDKVILNIRRINYKTYTAISFPIIFLADLVFWLIFRPALDWAMIVSIPGVLVAISTISIIITNLLYYRALKDDHVSEINILSLTTALPVILVNGLIFADERNGAVLVAAVVAALAVLWGHWDQHRLHFAKHTPVFLWWILFSAPINAAMTKIILTTWHPISLQLIRDGMIALVLILFFYRSVRLASSRAWLLLLITNVLSSAAWILFYTGYQHLGIVQTSLIFSVQPLLVYVIAMFLLKEPFVLKKFVAFMIVLISIAAAHLLK